LFVGALLLFLLRCWRSRMALCVSSRYWPIASLSVCSKSANLKPEALNCKPPNFMVAKSSSDSSFFQVRELYHSTLFLPPAHPLNFQRPFNPQISWWQSPRVILPFSHVFLSGETLQPWADSVTVTCEPRNSFRIGLIHVTVFKQPPPLGGYRDGQRHGPRAPVGQVTSHCSGRVF